MRAHIVLTIHIKKGRRMSAVLMRQQMRFLHQHHKLVLSSLLVLRMNLACLVKMHAWGVAVNGLADVLGVVLAEVLLQGITNLAEGGQVRGLLVDLCTLCLVGDDVCHCSTCASSMMQAIFSSSSDLESTADIKADC